MNKTSSAGRVSSNTRWLFKHELKAFMMLPVWMMGIRGLWKTCFQPMHESILKLWKSNGSLWVTQYLSEVSRIIVLWVNSTPYTRLTNGVQVRLTRAGLPLLLPKELRKIFHLLRGDDHAFALKVIRVTLSVLSVYRVIGCHPNVNLGTITSPFSGKEATLPMWELLQVVNMMPRLVVKGQRIWAYMSESAGPNFKKSTWSCGLDALAFLCDPLTWFHWLSIAWARGAWILIAWNLFTILVTLPIVPFLLLIGRMPWKLGRLSILYEARGKVRIVAITDWWTQVLLKPLHDAIFAILRTIPQDGTFDQLAPIHRLMAYVRASGSPVFSYDLSAATDRIPVAFQIQVLQSFGIGWAQSWASLLVGRPWYLNGERIYYAVGQPMGALSSWAMLALSHHVIVQISARRTGFQGWFPHYALLGDDIVIADESVARAYLEIMASLGVPINLSKSFEMATGGLEFAKRWFTPTLEDISPMSPGLILAVLRNPRILATFIRDSLSRGFIFSTRVVSDLGSFFRMLRPSNWMKREWKVILSSVLGPTGGLWTTASGPWFKAAWIKLFPHLVANKFGELIDILYRLLAESQTPPLSEEDSETELVSNFWKQVHLFRTDFCGLIWVPLLILSPAIWVYYDLVRQATERQLKFAQDKFNYESAMIGREWEYLDGMHVISRGLALADLIASTFDPGLLAWDRKLAEDDLRTHKRMFGEWASRVKTINMMAASRLLFTRPARRWVIPQRANTVPFHLSLVPLGYWGKQGSQKITLRPMDIPSSGRPH